MNTRTIILLILGGVAYFIFKEIFKFTAGISGTRNAMKKAVDELSVQLEALDLAPWDLDEMDLLSHDHSIEEKRSTYYVDYIGTWKSIYQEPLLGIAERRYRNEDKYVIAVRFNGKVYHFLPFKDQIELYRGEQQIGYISRNRITDLHMSDQVLRIESGSGNDLLPASIDEKHIWSITKFDEKLPLTRVVKEIDDFSHADGEKLILALSHAMMRQLI